MKKPFIITTLFILLFSNCVYAGSPNSSGNSTLSVTGGVSDNGKTQSTFDDARTVSGSAEEGAVVNVSVSVKDASGDAEIIGEYETVVGASGLFSQPIELSVGENTVCVKARFQNGETVEFETTIKRKRQEIKTKLENSVALPNFN